MAFTFAFESEKFTKAPSRMNRIEVDAALDKKIKALLGEWALRVSYSVTYDDGDGDEYTSSDIRYKALNEDHIVVAGGEPVGIMLEHIVYENNNSNCTDTYLYVLYFAEAPDVDIRLEGVRSGNRYVDGTAFYSLKLRSDMREGVAVESASSEFFPVPKVF